MTDLFTRLARRTLGSIPLVQPRITSRFVPEEAMASENTNIEIPSLFDNNQTLALKEQATPALSSKESVVRDREQKSITRTSRVEIERESPQKKELNSGESSISQPGKETQEGERKNTGKRATEVINEPNNTEVQWGLKAGNQELSAKENIRETNVGSERENRQRLESDSRYLTDNKESFEEIVAKGKKERVKATEAEEIPRENLGLIASQEKQKNPDANAPKATEIVSNEQKYSPKQNASISEQSFREIASKNKSRLADASEPQDQVSKTIQSGAGTARIFSKYQDKSRDFVNGIVPLDAVTEDKVDLKKVNSLEVERAIESESSLKSKESQELKSKTSGEELLLPNASIPLSKKAITDHNKGKVLPEEQIVAPEFTSRKSAAIVNLREQEKPRESKGIDEKKEILFPREEQWSNLAPKTANDSTKKGTNKGQKTTPRPGKLEGEDFTGKQISERLKDDQITAQESEPAKQAAKQSMLVDESKNKPAKLEKPWEDKNSNRTPEGIGEIVTQYQGRSTEDDRTENNPLPLLDSKLSEERKVPVNSTPTIEVTIGKIEVRGSKPVVKPVDKSRKRHSSVSSPKLSLKEYLKQRNQ